MFKKLTIDGKELEMVANAATPFRFKQIFGRDLLQVFTNEKRAESEGVEAVTQLAFVMTKQAEKTDMAKVNEAMFLEWLEDFGPMAFIEASEEILNLYMNSTKGTATP